MVLLFVKFNTFFEEWYLVFILYLDADDISFFSTPQLYIDEDRVTTYLDLRSLTPRSFLNTTMIPGKLLVYLRKVKPQVIKTHRVDLASFNDLEHADKE